MNKIIFSLILSVSLGLASDKYDSDFDDSDKYIDTTISSMRSGTNCMRFLKIADGYLEQTVQKPSEDYVRISATNKAIAFMQRYKICINIRNQVIK